LKTELIKAVAPTRICDVGGWTDTHFAKFGSIFNIAIYPYVEVQICTLPSINTDNRIVISADNYGDTYSISPNKIGYGKHPMLEAAIKKMSIPENISFKINIYSYAPPGASMGTSAAVSVALIGALDALTPNHLTAHEVAAFAHSIETDELNLECGIQDQMSSAYGGINFIDMYKYPHASISKVQTDPKTLWELEQRLLLVYIGTPHCSSEVHKKVISNLGINAYKDNRICRLRELASMAKNALFDNDLNALGYIFNENTNIQRALHKELVCDKFEEIISIAKEFNAIGCKVNGAGGDGGSIAILTNGDMAVKRKMEKIIVEKGYYTLPVYLSADGLKVWKTKTVNH